MERYYFYLDHNGIQRGPLSLKQLITENISPTTMVWHDGVSDWKCADQYEEIRQELIITSRVNVPPIPPVDFAPLYNTNVRPLSYRQRDVVIERPKKWIIESVLVTIFCCMPAGVVALIYALRSEDNWNAGLYNEALSASKSAGTWIKVSLIAIVIYPIIYLLMLSLGLIPFLFM